MSDTRLEVPAHFTSGELVLRVPTLYDVDRITEICQDPEIQRFTRVPSPYRRSDAESFVAMAQEAIDGGRGAPLLVASGGAIVGCVGFGIDAQDGYGSVGYWMAPESRRRGTATEAVRKLCRWCFDDLRLPRLELEAATTNPASNALASRLGFSLEGTRRSAFPLTAVAGLPADRVDVHVWGLLPGELR